MYTIMVVMTAGFLGGGVNSQGAERDPLTLKQNPEEWHINKKITGLDKLRFIIVISYCAIHRLTVEPLLQNPYKTQVMPFFFSFYTVCWINL